MAANIATMGIGRAGPGSPSPFEIVALAEQCGYAQRREMASATLFFVENYPPHGMPPVRINVYYTTRSLMTHLNHPNAGSNELWRSNAYDDLVELRAFFLNPRIHTGKGYRNAEKAVRGCVRCGETKARTDFSGNQWIKGPDMNKCKACTATSSSGDAMPDLATSLEGLNLGGDNHGASPPPTLTSDLLRAHDRESKPAGAAVRNGTERRQFNCPDCPKHGRGVFVFFKKVPALKPVVKCPQCKKASRGKCKRLYPIPRESEKGYGLFKCRTCKDTWGSSRAVANVGQECFTCLERGNGGVMVAPFRLEVPRKKKDGAGTRRVPKEPIGEDAADERAYGDADRERNFSGGESAFGAGPGGGGDESTRSYDIQEREQAGGSYSGSGVPGQAPVRPPRAPKGYRHKCAGCAAGLCKNRKVPKSEVHDMSDGNTVSTSASLVTNSSVDKSEFVDRDEDFSGFEADGEEWITV